MRQLKSSHAGVAGLAAVCLFLLLAPACGCQTDAGNSLMRAKTMPPLIPLLGHVSFWGNAQPSR
jgi:hypothetical protein